MTTPVSATPIIPAEDMNSLTIQLNLLLAQMAVAILANVDEAEQRSWIGT